MSANYLEFHVKHSAVLSGISLRTAGRSGVKKKKSIGTKYLNLFVQCVQSERVNVPQYAALYASRHRRRKFRKLVPALMVFF